MAQTLITPNFSDPDESLTPEEKIVDDFTTYETDHFTGSQVSLFLGPIWVEDFVSIQWKQTNSKNPMYGWNELYSDMDLDGKFLIQGTLTVNYRETDMLFRVINQLQEQLEGLDRREDIDRIIDAQKGKFRTRLETRLLQSTRGDTEQVARLIEQASQRIDIMVNELVNQNENVFDFDLSVIAGNYRSKNFAIKIFEGFNIHEEMGASQPDDSPLYTTYSFYARKSRSRRRNRRDTSKPIVREIDVIRMLEEIADRLIEGFRLKNLKSLTNLLSTQTNRERLSLFDIAGSEDYAAQTLADGTPNKNGKVRALLDIPAIRFDNLSIESFSRDQITASIDRADEVGFGGLVNAGTNNYGSDMLLNKVRVTMECPPEFRIDQQIYEFNKDPISGVNSPESRPIRGPGGIMPVVLSNHKGDLQHVDHEIAETAGFDIVGEIVPSPPQTRGSGLPIRTRMPVNAGTYNDKNRPFFTNSFLAYSQPVIRLINTPNPYDIDKSKRAIRDVTIKQPAFSFTYWDHKTFMNIEGEGSEAKAKIVRPMPAQFMDTLMNKSDLDDFGKTGKFSGDLNIPEEDFVGEDGKHFVLFPFASRFADRGDLITQTSGFGDFELEQVNSGTIDGFIKGVYGENVLLKEDFQFQPLTMHIFPLLLDPSKYLQQVKGLSGPQLAEKLRNFEKTYASKRDLLLELTSKSATADEAANATLSVPYKIDYDWVIKNSSALSPAGVSDALEFLLVHKPREPEGAAVTSDDYLFVQFFCMISRFPNFQNDEEFLREVFEREKKKGNPINYRFIDFRGTSSEVQFNSADPNSSDLKRTDSTALNQQVSRSVKLSYTFPIARRVEFETYLRSDYKRYEVRQSILDTFLNFTGITKNILTYMKEFKELTGNNFAPDITGLQEWITYLKGIAGSVVGFLQSAIQKTGDDDKAAALLPLEETLSEEENVIEDNLRNAAGFSADMYTVIDLEKIAKELYPYFSSSDFKRHLNNFTYGSTDAKEVDKARHGEVLHIRGGGTPSTPGSTIRAESNLIKRLDTARNTQIGGTEEQFVDFFMGILRRKMRPFNTSNTERIKIRFSRYYTDPLSKVVRQRPPFKDPASKEKAYLKFGGLSPSATVVRKFAKNLPAEAFGAAKYKFDNS